MYDHQAIEFIMMIMESGCNRQPRGDLGNFIADDCPRFRRAAPAAGTQVKHIAHFAVALCAIGNSVFNVLIGNTAAQANVHGYTATMIK